MASLKRKIKRKVKKKIKAFFRLLSSLRQSGNKFVAPYLVFKPKVINFNATDICNSHCRMCNIWKNKKENELNEADLKEILSDKLYQKVEHVGITGGEPTLRKDLASIAQAFVHGLPNLKGISIITNCIKVDEVKRRLMDVKNVCREGNVQFSVMVSLDGVGASHDYIRGTTGNFHNSQQIIEFVKTELNVPLFIGCTISKGNVWGVDEMLNFAKSARLNTRFRIAEFIERLNNDDRAEDIRNFTPEEVYQLRLFFFKLKKSFEKTPAIKRTYENIFQMLGGASRGMGCPYQTSGAVLGARGDLGFCAPKSAFMGNAKVISSSEIFGKSFPKKKKVLKEKCKDCIHDYHHPELFQQLWNEKRSLLFEKLITFYLPDHPFIAQSFSKLLPKKTKNPLKKILIVGWYGTETVGDKAILGGIVDKLFKKYGGYSLTIASIHPFVTERTLIELEIDANVVPYHSLSFLRESAASDVVIMGGGPLMEIDELNMPYLSFLINSCRSKEAERVIYGCGLGPLYSQKSLALVKKIFELSTLIKLRDSDSVVYAREKISKEFKYELSGDSARDYIQNRYLHLDCESGDEEPYIACFLRDLPIGYYKKMNVKEFESLRLDFELGLFELIQKKRQAYRTFKVILNNMHNFVVGNDDRDFGFYFKTKYFPNDDRVVVQNKLSTVDSVVRSMKGSELNLCMRFHSVLFAETLKTKYLAIDYTAGGKILGYLKDVEGMENYISANDVARRLF